MRGGEIAAAAEDLRGLAAAAAAAQELCAHRVRLERELHDKVRSMLPSLLGRILSNVPGTRWDAPHSAPVAVSCSAPPHHACTTNSIVSRHAGAAERV